MGSPVAHEKSPAVPLHARQGTSLPFVRYFGKLASVLQRNQNAGHKLALLSACKNLSCRKFPSSVVSHGGLQASGKIASTARFAVSSVEKFSYIPPGHSRRTRGH